MRKLKESIWGNIPSLAIYFLRQKYASMPWSKTNFFAVRFYLYKIPLYPHQNLWLLFNYFLFPNQNRCLCFYSMPFHIPLLIKISKSKKNSNLPPKSLGSMINFCILSPAPFNKDFQVENTIQISRQKVWGQWPNLSRKAPPLFIKISGSKIRFKSPAKKYGVNDRICRGKLRPFL